jgi:hypothetical protein
MLPLATDLDLERAFFFVEIKDMMISSFESQGLETILSVLVKGNYYGFVYLEQTYICIESVL